MKNPWELIRSKEQELQRVRREVEALKIAARLLEEDEAYRADGQHASRSQPVETT
jgi:hypothetical protein